MINNTFRKEARKGAKSAKKMIESIMGEIRGIQSISDYLPEIERMVKKTDSEGLNRLRKEVSFKMKNQKKDSKQ